MAAGPNGADAVALHRLPREVLAAVLAGAVCGPRWLQALRLLGTVCRHWHELCRHDGVWADIARRSFAAYPLLRDFPSTPPSSPAAAPESPKRPPRPPTLERLEAAYSDVGRYRLLVRHKELVAERRRYVLHMLVSFTLLLFTAAGLCFMCAIEAVGPTAYLSIDHGFSLLYATYLLVAATVIANVTMTVHFEPTDVYHRMQAHRGLIILTIGVLAVMLVVAVLPTYLVQCVVVSNADRAPGIWLVCALPPSAAFVAWQAHVVFAYRRRLRGWWRRGHAVPSAGSLRLVAANLTPTMFACSALSVARYAETDSFLALVFACVPVLFASLVLAGLFALDYLSRPNTRPVDGIAALCVLAAAFFPFSALFMPLRGFTALPLVLASGGFFCAHALETVRLFATLMESNAMFLLE